MYGGRTIPLTHEKVSKTATAENVEKKYEVHRILKHTIKKGVIELLSLWRGYREEDTY